MKWIHWLILLKAPVSQLNMNLRERYFLPNLHLMT